MRKILSLIFFFLIISSFQPFCAYAGGFLIFHPKYDMKSHELPPLKSCSIDIIINNKTAKTTIEQIYENTHSWSFKGALYFPISDDNQITDIQALHESGLLRTEILDKEKSAKFVKNLVKEKCDPSFFELSEKRLLKVYVSNIEPRKEKKIILKYTQKIAPDNGFCRYSCPLSSAIFSPEPLKSFKLSLKISSDIPISTFFSTSHELIILKDSSNKVEAVFEKEDYKPDGDLELIYAISGEKIGVNSIAYSEPQNNGGWLAVFLKAPDSINAGEIIPKDIIFVADTSGSMKQDGKINAVKNILKSSILKLNKDDRFGIVTFADEAEKFKAELSPADKTSTDEAIEYISSLNASGGADIKEAIISALSLFDNKDRAKFVIFITDSIPTKGATNSKEIINEICAANKNNAVIYAFAIGHDVNTRILDLIAGQSGGSAFYISSAAEIENTVASFIDSISNPIISGIKIESPDIKINSEYPSRTPYIFAGKKSEIFLSYSGKMPSSINIKGKTKNGEFFFKTDNIPLSCDADNSFIARLWAKKRLGELFEKIRYGDENNNILNDISQITRKFGIWTPFSSPLISEEGKQSLWLNFQLLFIDKPSPIPLLPPKTSIFSSLAGNQDFGDSAISASKEIAKLKNNPCITCSRDNVRVINDKRFFLKGKLWVDSDYTGKEKIIKIKFNSPDYYKIASRAATYLSAGKSVAIKIKDTLYLIEP